MAKNKKPTQVSSEDAKEPEDYSAQGLEARYQQLSTIREPVLKRAREYSRLTIPSMIPPLGHTPSSPLYKPWQSIGARGVNNLAAKILLALLPANTPFFRFLLSEMTLQKLKAAKQADQYQQGLAQYEREVMNEVETGNTRVSAFEAIQHLIVAGNALCYMPLKGGMKVYHLDAYVVSRDGMGNVLEIITEENLGVETLPEEIQSLVAKRCKDKECSVKLYTTIVREDNKFRTWQEVKGIRVPNSDGNYTIDACPYIPLRWMRIDGEDYGRGHIESLIGDLRSAEGLRQSIVEGSVASSKMLFLVNPNGVTKQKTIAEAPNGAVRSGKADDVSCLQADKQADLRVAQETFADIKGDLEASFLGAASIQRDAERVTAEEIRIMANELESALGGVYSLLANEFQLPLVNRLIDQMVKQKRLPKLPKSIVRPAIVTGLEALSRGSDLQKLDMFAAGFAPIGGMQVAAQYCNIGDLLMRRATALQITNPKTLIKSDEDIAAEQQQQQQQAAASTLGPHLIKAGVEAAKMQQANQQPQDQNAESPSAT